MARRLIRAGWLIVLVAGVTGCATKYRHFGKLKGGYVDARLSDDTFKVSFAGNSFTARTTTEVYLMYRCAEVAAAAGYDSFEILRTSGNWSAWPPDGQVSSSRRAPESPWLTEHQAHHAPGEYGAVIKAFKGEKPQGAYDAKELLRFLGPSIRR